MAGAGRSASLVAILSACLAFAIGMGLTLPLLSLILERRGFPGSVNGLNLATAGLAAFCVTPQVPRLMRTFGTAAYMSGSLVLSAISLIALYEVQSFWAWLSLRFALSIGLNGLFVCSEFWINQLATERNRGRYISLYGACISGGFGVGPAILTVLGTQGLAPFAIGSTMLLLALVPVLIARKAAPQLDATPGLRYSPSSAWRPRFCRLPSFSAPSTRECGDCFRSMPCAPATARRTQLSPSRPCRSAVSRFSIRWASLQTE